MKFRVIRKSDGVYHIQRQYFRAFRHFPQWDTEDITSDLVEARKRLTRLISKALKGVMSEEILTVEVGELPQAGV